MASSIFRPAVVRRIVHPRPQLPCGPIRHNHAIRNASVLSYISSRPNTLARTPQTQPNAPSSTLASANPPTIPNVAGETLFNPTPSDSPTPPPSRTRRFLSATALLLLFGSLGLTITASPSLPVLHSLRQPPTDSETLALWTPPSPAAEEINHHILNCALAQHLRADPSFVESRPILKIPAQMRTHNLTAGTLLGEDRLAAPPLTFLDANVEAPRMVQIAHLGPALCGHPGVIHGGLIATLLDEGLARACFPALPNKVGVTANLKVEYRAPCPSGSYVVLRAETTKVDGRKVWVRGQLEVLDEEGGEGTVVAVAEALFIEPRGAKNMARIYSPSK